MEAPPNLSQTEWRLRKQVTHECLLLIRQYVGHVGMQGIQWIEKIFLCGCQVKYTSLAKLHWLMYIQFTGTSDHELSGTNKHRRLLAISSWDSNQVLKKGMSLCSGMPPGNSRATRSSNHSQRVHSVGLGQRRTSGDNDDVEDARNSAAGRGTLRDHWPCLLWRL